MRREGHGRAAGKLILLGEHVVVHGAPALAVGIERGLAATARRAERASVLTLLAHSSSADGELSRAYDALLGSCVAPIETRVDGDLVPGVGLGFSAAAAVAIARAVEDLLADAGDSEARALARATAWERVFHGNPSGVDTAAAMHGGCIRFTRAEGPVPFTPARAFELCVGLSGTASSTVEMVERVAARCRALPVESARAIAGVGELVEEAVAALRGGEFAALGALMDRNQRVLADFFGLSNAALDELCARARDAGAFGAKLSGAGGGGVVVALCGAAPSPVAEPVLAAWRAAGLSGFRTVVGASVRAAAPVLEGRS